MGWHLFLHLPICSSIHLSIYPFIHPSTHLRIHLPIYSSFIYPSIIYPSAHLLIHPPIHPSTILLIHSFIRLSSIHLPICSSIHPSSQLFNHPPIHSSIYPSINSSTYKPTHSFIYSSSSVHLLIYSSICPPSHLPILLSTHPSSVYPSVHLSIHSSSTHLSSIRPSIHLPIHSSSIHLSSIYLSTHLSVHHPSIHPSSIYTHPSAMHQPIYLSIRSSTHLLTHSSHLFSHPAFFLSIHPPICPSNRYSLESFVCWHQGFGHTQGRYRCLDGSGRRTAPAFRLGTCCGMGHLKYHLVDDEGGFV